MKKKLFLTVAVLIYTYMVYPQIIDNKINTYISFCYGSFMGGETCRDGSFVTTSLFSNYSSLSGISVKTLVKKNDLYSLGLGISAIHASGWTSNSSDLYDNSNVNQFSLSPTIQFHHRLKEELNRISVFAEVAPTIGFTKLSISNPLFVIEGQGEEIDQPMTSNDAFIGLKASVGFEVALNTRYGLFVLYSIDHSRTGSELYNNNSFTGSGINLGFFLRLKKEKRFYL